MIEEKNNMELIAVSEETSDRITLANREKNEHNRRVRRGSKTLPLPIQNSSTVPVTDEMLIRFVGRMDDLHRFISRRLFCLFGVYLLACMVECMTTIISDPLLVQGLFVGSGPPFLLLACLTFVFGLSLVWKYFIEASHEPEVIASMPLRFVWKSAMCILGALIICSSAVLLMILHSYPDHIVGPPSGLAGLSYCLALLGALLIKVQFKPRLILGCQQHAHEILERLG
jgi:hypothetical protein